ncbi:hypothetical protein FOZ63_005084, partial [Perkinsus olseni]
FIGVAVKTTQVVVEPYGLNVIYYGRYQRLDSLEKAYKALEEENDTVKEQLKQREESLEDANTQVRERERQLQTAHQVSGLVNLAQVLCVGCLIPVLGALLLLLLAQPLLPPPLKDSEQEGTRNRGVRLPLGGMAVLRLMVVLSAAIGFLDSVISSHFCINCACCFVVNG